MVTHKVQATPKATVDGISFGDEPSGNRALLAFIQNKVHERSAALPAEVFGLAFTSTLALRVNASVPWQ